ncbi:MAG: hypothetical protein KDM81_13830, partial [Verrucomicrobiae bacterium]|nr:hypothetical protein [Verrucomicrobiae bacterium]
MGNLADLGCFTAKAGNDDQVILTLDEDWQGSCQLEDPEGGWQSHDQFQGTFHATGWWQWRTNDTGGITLEKVREEVQVNASGGGSYDAPEAGIHWSWNYHAEPPPPNDDGSPYDLLYLDYDRETATIWVSIEEPLTATYRITGDEDAGGSAADAARFAVADMIQKVPIYTAAIEIDPAQPSFRKVLNGAGTFDLLAPTFTGSAHSTLVVSFNQPPLEAIIETAPDYEDWLPKAGATEEVPGTQVPVVVHLNQSGAKARYTAYLEDVSRQPGLCMNHPYRSTPATQDADPAAFDLKFAQAAGLTVSEDGQKAWTENEVETLGLVINAYDYGAYGRLRVEAAVPGQPRVEAHLKDQPEQHFLRIPFDENENWLADTWEDSEGILGQIEDPRWDEADDPAYHHTKGDGISLYEKYRGFMIQGVYERLKPRRKYVFIRDREGWGQMVEGEADGPSFSRASQCEVRFIGPKEWTGPGTAGEDRRIVNFNSFAATHATDQHAVHLVANYDADPIASTVYNDAYDKKHGQYDPAVTAGLWDAPGTTWPDPSTAADPGGGSSPAD